jgi:hypothetical protein
MRIHVDRRSGKSLVSHFRARDYLAVERAPGIVEAVPIASRDERADRERTLKDLDAWATANPTVAATPLWNFDLELEQDLGGQLGTAAAFGD